MADRRSEEEADVKLLTIGDSTLELTVKDGELFLHGKRIENAAQQARFFNAISRYNLGRGTSACQVGRTAQRHGMLG